MVQLASESTTLASQPKPSPEGSATQTIQPRRSPRVLHISASCDPIGGIATYIRQISDSSLGDDFEFAYTHYPCSRWSHAGSLRTLVQKVRAFAPDLVHVHGLQIEGLIGVLAARLGGSPRIVVTIHGFMEDSLARNAWKRWLVAKAIEPWALILSSAFYCVSTYGTTKWVVQRCVRRSLGTINNALPFVPPSSPEVSRSASESNRCKALFVGRVTRDKGVFDLVPVLAQARERCGIDIRLTLVGDGPDLTAFRALVASSQMAEHINCVGRQSNPAPYFAEADVFLLPSYHEHQSYAILEAMRAGLPVLAYDTGGNSELVVADVTGRLSPLGDKGHMITQLAALAGDRTLRHQLGQAGHDRLLREFGYSRFLGEVSAVYRRLLAGGRCPPTEVFSCKI